MPGTIEGGKRAAQTNKLKHGEDFYKKIGQRGGKFKSPTKGFGSMEKAKISAAGRKGGIVSRRKPKPTAIDTVRISRHKELSAAELTPVKHHWWQREQA